MAEETLEQIAIDSIKEQIKQERIVDIRNAWVAVKACEERLKMAQEDLEREKKTYQALCNKPLPDRPNFGLPNYLESIRKYAYTMPITDRTSAAEAMAGE